MANETPPVVKRSIFSWIIPGNGKLQIFIVILIAFTVVTRVLPLEMQKRIINRAISLNDLQLLYMYCALYLGAVVLSQGLKYAVNVLQTLISQRVLTRMREDLYHHILTLPLSFFRRTQPGLVVSALVSELVSAGEYAGMAIAMPLINILTLLAFAGYLFYLNWILALICIGLYPIILVLVPVLQRKANKANRTRVDITRDVADRITDTIAGIHEVHGNGSYRIENNKFDKLVRNLEKIRVKWTLYTQAVKTSNNFFTGLGPFFIFLIGGYLAMKGQLALGSLVAFLSAQEKLYDPWRELIGFYQLYQDARVRYDKVMGYFDTDLDFELTPVDREPYELEAKLEVKDLSFVTDDGIRLLDGINFSLEPGEHMALVGFSGSGKSTLALCVGQLYKYNTGHVLLGGQEVKELTKDDMTQNMGFVSQSPFIFAGTIEENLLYACAAAAETNEDGQQLDMPGQDEIIGVLQQTGVYADVLRLGLNTILSPKRHEELASRLIRVRQDFQDDFGEELADYVEFYNANEFLRYSSVSENLTFGTANSEEFLDDNLPNNDYFLEFLTSADLTRPLLSLGAELARQTVDILGNLPPDKVLFEQSPIRAEDIEEYKILTEMLRKKRLHEITDNERAKLLGLALRFIPGRHKMVGLPRILEQLILEGRALFRDKISQDNPEAISFYDQSLYIYSQTILNNILFGKTKTHKIEAQEKINQSVIQLLIAEDFLETIVEIGLQFDVGSKGENLSGGQRQKLAIARTFLKAPRLMILDEATSALDNKSQTRVQNQMETRWKGRSTAIAVVHRLDITKKYDKIAVMKAGKIAEMGTYDELMSRKGLLYELAHGKK
jgi:ABC-type multidrug transport system fused ATPase/permease subunit